MVRPLPGITLFPYTTLFRSSITNSETIEYDDENEDGLIEDCQTIEYEDEYDADIMLFEVEIYFHNKDEKGILDRKSTRLNSSHVASSYAVFCLKKRIRYCLL